ncbi:hypothetical protein BV98_003426 [Sphingobium herbicidovorans NBRC 16415]|uniref:Uncharacterized protein n=1 Tax=Sphingobium herbicidovorans (strain ATCC 700291 / DSM 11019 / CCUG 56400 / KCTC 2939 / LMG 18315 / NBRC 16415 / MH) TaxID=1219045 RepID=A0A086P5X2_SPHHM|nr:hypothetical protein BV98_003426 [Sphingobium herbicidovorans NBRC 16415]
MDLLQPVNRRRRLRCIETLGEVQALFADPHGLEVVIDRIISGEADAQLAVAEPRDLFVLAGSLYLDRDMGAGGHESAHQLRNDRVDCRSEIADVEAPELAGLRCPRFFDRGMADIEQALRLDEEQLPGFGYLHTFRGSDEQFDTELVLQLLDLPRDWRLRDMQLARCGGQIAFFGDGNKIA